jgi:hypothetical protein
LGSLASQHKASPASNIGKSAGKLNAKMAGFYSAFAGLTAASYRANERVAALPLAFLLDCVRLQALPESSLKTMIFRDAAPCDAIISGASIAYSIRARARLTKSYRSTQILVGDNAFDVEWLYHSAAIQPKKWGSPCKSV